MAWSRRSRYEDDELPWDPLWEYVLGDDEDYEDPRVCLPGRRSRQADSDTSILDFFTFSENEFRDEAAAASTSNQAGAYQRTNRNTTQTTTKKPQRRGFWRMSRREGRDDGDDFELEEGDTYDIGSFEGEDSYNSVDEIGVEHNGTWGSSGRKGRFGRFRRHSANNSYDTETLQDDQSSWNDALNKQRKQRSILRRGGRGRQSGSVESLSSSRTNGVRDSSGKVSAESKSATFDPWGESSSDEEQSYESSKGNDEATNISSHASEGASRLSDNSNAISTKKPDVGTNEIHLKFRPSPENEGATTLSRIDEEREKSSYTVGEFLDKEDTSEEATEAQNDTIQIIGTNHERAMAEESAELPSTPQTLPLFGSQTPGRVACCSIKDLSNEQLLLAMRSGLPIHELSQDELAAIFPKVRSIVDDKSEEIGNSNSFDRSCPAHLQAAIIRQGRPQSLLEYDYETGLHMYVCYSAFGDSGRSSIKAQSAPRPPEQYENGLVVYNKVVVQVEASTVSQTDCYIRNGYWWGKETVPLPNTPGADIVGKIYRIDSESSRRTNLFIGDRVISLTKWGGNSRFLAVDPMQLVKVPDSVDPAAVVCLTETYLSAFQLLHYGQTRRKYRTNALKGKTFLILGHMELTMGRAISQVAFTAGAECVFASTKQRHAQQIRNLGIVPLNKERNDWFDKLRESIDIIISFEQDVNVLQYQLLKPNGEIILVSYADIKFPDNQGRIRHRAKFTCSRNHWQHQSKTHVYDLFKEWDRNLEQCKMDLEHLVKLLEKGALIPHILDRIPLSKVGRAQDLIEAKRLSGFLVCEPWLVVKARAVRL